MKEQLALQLANPSIQELLKNQTFDLTSDNVIKELNELINQKVNAVSEHKETFKEALKNDVAVSKSYLDLNKIFPKAGSSYTSFFDTFLNENIVTNLREILYVDDPSAFCYAPQMPLKEYPKNFGDSSLRATQYDYSFKDSFSKLDQLLSSNGVVIKYARDYDHTIIPKISTDIAYGLGINHHIELSYTRNAFPKPMHFKNETDFIKAVSVMLADEKFESYVNPKFEHSDYKSFLIETAGFMLAHQLGAPVTQNDINRLSRWYCHANHYELRRDPKFNFDPKIQSTFLNQIFKEAGSLVNCINKACSVENSPIKSNWDYWVSNRTLLDKVQSNSKKKKTPSSISKDDPLKNIKEITTKKILIVEQNKELIKAALSQDQALSQTVPELVFDLQPQKLSDLIKAAEKKGKSTKRKGAER